MTDSLNEKRDKLCTILDRHGKRGLVVCYSGGCDSTLLAAMAREAGVQPLLLLTFATPTISRYDLEAAADIAAGLGLQQRVSRLDTLLLPDMAENSRKRCYHCKLALYREALSIARTAGYGCVADGGNADDRAAHRPGNQAIDELGICQPLAEARLTKAEIRCLAASMGLPNADRPASPCLASRFPYGSRLDTELLQRVEQGESLLRELGLRNFRLRVHDDLARLEVARQETAAALLLGETINAGLRRLGYRYITLDLEELASGSFDRV